MTRSLRAVIGAASSAVLISGAFLLTTAAPAAATVPAAPCAQKGLNKEIRQADVVFRGVVDKARPVRGKGKAQIRTYLVTADRVYKSSLVADRVRVTAEVGATCPPRDLKEGKRYIFFVTEQGAQLVLTPATARATHQLTSQVEAKLGSGKPPRPAPPTTAQFTKVADAAPPALSRLLAPGAALLIISLLGLLLVARLGRRTT